MPGHYKAPTYKPTTSITLDETLFTRIDKFRHRNEFDSRSEAIDTLIKLGFKYLQEKKAAKQAVV
ncbi:CopG family ribbon-helix-helix protein [Metabacillus sp. Hm71]|uniref:CopG family ribbon-helix-helix protein n=1 Tax=Metabacillus sp. Hm71 TaxID=3450743 RepID=UPI003F43C064